MSDLIKKIPVTKKEIFGWCCYDFANSSFTTIIVTVIFSQYFVSRIASESGMANTLWSGALALSQGLVMLMGPWLGAMADKTAKKKWFLTASAMVCSLFTALLYFAEPGWISFALGIFIIANICFALGENFCASFLPEISTPENCGKISGYGWSFGYLGGLLSLVLCFVALDLGNTAGDPDRLRWAFPLTGAFFAIAALPTILLLNERKIREAGVSSIDLLRKGFGEVITTIRTASKSGPLFKFFLAFTFYMAGLSSVISFASIFGAQRFGMQMDELIQLFIALQVTSAAGAFAFGFFQDKFGALLTLRISLVGWILICLGVFLCDTKTGFWICAMLAGLVIGSTQSASRAFVSSMAPEEKSAEIFGYWGFFSRLAGMIGPFLFGITADSIGMQEAMWVNVAFFIVGLILVRKTYFMQKSA